ncbi:hypothetical protein Dtox_1439 [Desulfofarcimen acetoxidans DSM 771]|uniref:Transposase n=1 Tax=Desulfofarcimen acetoxidans (strain ATCC 49208 / DSM 771 / KCTC 5769 / VKM B-1644 / 5575) TaxID=485916 RepID=C8VVJ5_DESAS|nr:hypothetical protein [Desulfofarcimen acetoxidans]ACV62310.1 hypothetical protein Dtox_1439 [Desulfofarcimen acetoxidans DSM 771]
MDKQEQHALVVECRASGMTAKAWCQAKDIEYSQYLNWARRVNREKQHALQQWANVTIEKEKCIQGEIRLSCGKWTICVESGFSPALLADVLRVVDGVC